MSTYAIGDIQGCFKPLMRLLEKIQFNDKQDVLWFAGDLVNRGTQSLETLRFIKSLKKQAITVLGNHDLTLLAVAKKVIPFKPHVHTFEDVLSAPDCEALLTWLSHQPLLHHDPVLNFTLVHAGFPPQWDLSTALSLAKEVEITLQGPEALDFFKHMYGNLPNIWDPQLSGWDRLRFIVNCFTRLRFCDHQGHLELSQVGPEDSASEGLYPWFKIPKRRSQHLNILFGHWASLRGHTDEPTVFPLDTGCIWGHCLTAFRLEDRVKISVQC
jgi:bis(5'-nucleosyl)-tetraphosphatase (symmetrical)